MKISIILLVIMILGACQPKDSQITQNDIDEINQKRDEFVIAVKASDFEKMKSIYAEDCVVLPPGTKENIGSANQVEWAKTLPPITDFAIVNSETEGNGMYAIARGEYSITVKIDTSEMTDKGKYIEVWKKQTDDSWRLFRDIWNSSLPAR